ncbi:MAG: ABC transporter ATP-binding protein [Deltaproteobacteria bacterium]|nr:ABC transporter ATP-binding protein [Deltaproteobacteria bacterium]
MARNILNFVESKAGGVLVPSLGADPTLAPNVNSEGLYINGISKTFDRKRGKVLDKITMHVPKDSFFALLGPSGCGKSTLLRIIAGLEYPDEGEIYLDGKDISKLPAQLRPVNTVFQSFALFPHLTVFENIAFGLRAQGTFNTSSYKIGLIVESLQLSGLEEVYPDQLSGGQQQRVALARALVNEPKVLLLDEPMSHLDDYLKCKVGQDLRDLQERLGTIFIMVTHDREDAMAISNQMAIINKGKIIQHDKPRSIFSKPNCTFVAEFMGKANIFEAKRTDDRSKAFLPFCQVGFQEDIFWDTAWVLINPDTISIQDPIESTSLEGDSPLGTVKATIVQVRYKGYNVELLCKLPNLSPGNQGHSLLQVLTTDHAREWKQGETLSLQIDAKEMVILGEPSSHASGLDKAQAMGSLLI